MHAVRQALAQYLHVAILRSMREGPNAFCHFYEPVETRLYLVALYNKNLQFSLGRQRLDGGSPSNWIITTIIMLLPALLTLIIRL